ncbi:MAG: flavin reductase family protein [Rubrivivax sp.]
MRRPHGKPAAADEPARSAPAGAATEPVASGAAAKPQVELALLRRALGRFTTGVTIVSCLDARGRPVGLTVNSFNALSLDPPLVLWSLRESSASVSAFAGASHFVVNVLAEGQLEISRRFASRISDKFAAVDWSPGIGGGPVLSGCAAVFECENSAQQIVGDHHLYFGRVLVCSEQALKPLIYQGGHYRRLGTAL